MAQGDRYNEPFFWHRVVNVGWGGGWGVLAIDIPEAQNLINAHGFFPIGPFAVGELIVPSTLFVTESGQLDSDNWLWFVQIPPLPPVLEELYDVITEPARDRWIIEGYIDAPEERNEDQEADFQQSTTEITADLGYAFVEDSVGAYIRVDSGTTDPPDNTWAGTGDYPVPQTVFQLLKNPMPGRQFRYWYRYDPTEPGRATRDAVRLTFILNFAGGPPAFAEPEEIINADPEADEHLPAYNMKFKLDIYRRSVVLEVKETTVEGPVIDRIYSQTREVSYTAPGTAVTIAKTGFV